jgi:vacuolar-type H+-ATPase subunit I/STV1
MNIEMENQPPTFAELVERKLTLENNLEAAVHAAEWEAIVGCNARLRELEPMLKASEITDIRKTLDLIEEERLELSRQTAILEEELEARQQEYVKASDIANQRRIDFQHVMLSLGVIDSRQTDLLESRRERKEKLKAYEKALLSRAINS